MICLDLFSGIGGFALGFHWAGIETICFCEINKYCRQVLRKHWNHVPIVQDIRRLHAVRQSQRKAVNGVSTTSLVKLFYDGVLIYEGPIDIISGGFPCQPFSHAGQRRGEADDRDLWPEMFRLIQEIRPTWVLGENVAGFVNMGLERTIANLESEAYEVQSFVIPACAIGAPHRRDRVWIVSYSPSERLREAGAGFGRPATRVARSSSESPNVADPGSDAERASTGPSCRRDAERQQHDGNKVRDDPGNSGEAFPDPSVNQEGGLPEREEKKKSGPSQRSAFVTDTNPTGRRERWGAESARKEQFASQCYRQGEGYKWPIEPDVGRVVARISTWLDGGKINAETKNPGNRKILHELSKANESKTLQWPVRGFGSIQTEEQLLEELCEFKAKPHTLGNVSLESEKTQEVTMRGVWFCGETSCSSCRRESEKQRTREHPDTLHLLSQLLACDCRSAWLDPTGTPSKSSRVDRIKAIGNSVVPYFPYLFGKAMKEFER